MIAPNESFGGTVRILRPCVDVWGCCAALGKDEDEVLELLDDGSIQWGWNIGTETRRCIRVLVQSITDYQQGRKVNRSLASVAALLIPHTRPTVRLSELYRALNFSGKQAMDLLREGEFGPQGRSFNQRKVQRQSPTVPREAVLRFLQRRRVA